MSEPERLIDLRSDTVTRPAPEMRRAMAEAEVGDDVLGDDPTVIRLQEVAAELFGKEAGLYVPSGTMSNQIALHAQTTPGDEIFLHAKAHIVENEQGGAAVLSGLQTRTFDSDDGTLDLDLLEHYFHKDDDVHHPRTTLVAVENTHNYCGGVVYPLEQIRALRAFCDRHGMILHLDGARVCNAAVASGVALRDIVAPYDSVSVCLSKGLGAPVGSVLLGSAALIARAQRARKLFGGGMRQAGIIAAGGLYALEHNVARLADDHRRARALGERLARVPGFAIDQRKLQTNMVFADTHGTGLPAARVVELLAAQGVLALDEAPWSVRFVTHLDVDDADIKEAGELVASALERVSA
ncbi:MAG: low-specificity L-threonine aldolase [Thermoleophilia bacterium]